MSEREDLRLAPYRPGDEEPIVGLYRSTFDPHFDLGRWRWWYDHNPLGEKLIELAWSDDVLAAHYAVCPVRLTVAGELVRTSLSLHTMTHPDFRGMGLFPRLAERVYRRMADLGYLMVWGFPNEVSHRGFAANLGWSDVYEIPTLRLDPSTVRRPPQPSPRVSRVAVFDQRFDRLWARVSGELTIATVRDSVHLRWRYGSHPFNAYTTFALELDGELAGYAVTKQYEGGLDVVDLLTVDSAEVAAELLGHLVAHARDNALAPVCAWFPVRHPTHHLFERLGFENCGPVTYLGCRRLGPPPCDLAVERVEGWYYTMGDSDVY